MEALWEEERAKQVEEHLNKLAQEASVADLTPAEHAQRSRAARIALHTIPKSNPAYVKKDKKSGGGGEGGGDDEGDEGDDDMFDGYLGARGNRNHKKKPQVEKEKRSREETKKMADEMKVISKTKEKELDDFLKNMAMEVRFCVWRPPPPHISFPSFLPSFLPFLKFKTPPLRLGHWYDKRPRNPTLAAI
jgi:hypothetical protein